MAAEPASITALLAKWKAGDRAAEAEVIAAVHPVLHEIARIQVRRNSGALSLRATELVSEAYLRLNAGQQAEWQDRNHFFAVAAMVIRRVIVDHLRTRTTAKRGGAALFVPLDSLDEKTDTLIDESVDWLAVDEALSELERVDRGAARVIELRFFAGLTAEQIAEAEGSSTASVSRRWRFGRAWLARRLGGAVADSGGDA